MKRWFKMLTGSLAVVLFITFSCAAFAAAPVKLRTAWLDEHEAFLVWYAKEKGWDKEEGLDIEMLLFSSGMAQLNALPAGEWVLAGTGAVPGMMGALRYGTYTIAVTNDESYTNALLLRPDSPILKTKGYNKDYPEVYGHPDDVRGKTFLITTMSSPHFTLSHWLRVLGLKESDVTIKNIDQAQGLAAFDSGIGDGVCLWAPHMFFGMDKGWKVAGTPNTCGVGLPTVLMGDKKFCDASWSPSSCACSCAPPTCSRKKPRNPSPRNTAASSRNSWARALRRKWPRSTSRRTPFSTLKNSSPCSTAPRGRARPPSGWPTSPNSSPAWAGSRLTS